MILNKNNRKQDKNRGRGQDYVDTAAVHVAPRLTSREEKARECSWYLCIDTTEKGTETVLNIHNRNVSIF